MLYFLIAFLALTAFTEWNSLFIPPAAICSYHTHLSMYKHGYHNTVTCCIEEIPNLDLTLEKDVIKSILSLFYLSSGHKTHNCDTGYKTHNAGLITHSNYGCKTHNTGLMTHSNDGCKTHNMTGIMTHSTTGLAALGIYHKSFIQCNCSLLTPGCITGLPISQFKEPYSELGTHIYPHKHHSDTQFDQKKYGHYKCSALSLVLAINRSIYYLLNSTFNHANDINHLMKRLLLTLQRYMIRCSDFKHSWFTLLLSGLLRSQNLVLWFLMVFFLRMRIVAWKFLGFFLCVWTCIWFSTLCYPSILQVSDWSTTGFIGGGRSARTDYEILKNYILSTEVQLKNPEEFNYVYSRHCTLENAMQEIKTSGDAHLVCNIPLALVAKKITSTQANEVAKIHNIPALSRKSLVEKQKAVEFHVCSKICNECVTMFKPVKKNQKSIQHQHSTKLKELKIQPKVGRKSWGKPARAVTNHKYYVQENLKFPPSPPSKRLMHKIISGFCSDTHPSKFEEAGCAVCGQLVVMTNLVQMTDVKCSLDPLVRVGVTRLPRCSIEDPIKEMDGPIVDAKCKHICHECIRFLEKR